MFFLGDNTTRPQIVQFPEAFLCRLLAREQLAVGELTGQLTLRGYPPIRVAAASTRSSDAVSATRTCRPPRTP